jgi:Asp/Glu/hydantoin racemase
MKKVRLGLIRVVTYTDPSIAGQHGRLIERLYPEFEVLSRCIPDQPKGIYDDASEAAAVPKIIALGERMCRDDGIAGLIISCAADPAVAELREKVSVPVIGAGSSGACLALTYGRRVGTLGITEGTPAVMKALLGEALVAERRPDGVTNTLELNTAAGRDAAFAALEYLTSRGATVIALACTGFATLGVADEMESRIGRPVIDPVVAAGHVARFYLGRREAA